MSTDNLIPIDFGGDTEGPSKGDRLNELLQRVCSIQAAQDIMLSLDAADRFPDSPGDRASYTLRVHEALKKVKLHHMYMSGLPGGEKLEGELRI